MQVRRRSRSKRPAAAALSLLAALVSAPVQAGSLQETDSLTSRPLTSRKDVQVVVRTFAFLAPPLSGTVPVAVIYDPGSPVSSAEALTVTGWLRGEGRTNTLQVSPRLLPVTGLDQLEGCRAAFIMHGLEPHYGRIGEAASRQGILAVSADETCARDAACGMAVVSEPQVRILLNHAAIRAAHVEFATAFRILVDEQ